MILIIIIIVWPCQICCWIYPDGCSSGGSSDPFKDAQIEFTHDGVLAITEITNRMEVGGAPQSRSGFLVQLGSYRSTGTVPTFEKVDFMSGSTVVGTLDVSDFTWIDIIGDDPSASGPPIDPGSELPFMLWPGGRPLCSDAAVREPCVDLSAQVGGILYPRCDNCDDPLIVDALCLRSRTIHAYFDEVTNFVTIWQGEDGIDIRFSPEAATTEGRLDSSYLMSFESNPTVAAYKLESECTVTEVTVPTGWDRLVFHANLLPGQGGGDRQDPPWP